MAEKVFITITNMGSQKDYITFLKQVLKTCIIFEEKLSSGYRNIFFREKGLNHSWHGIQEEGWGNSLSCCVYNSIVSGTKLEISQSDDAVSGETIPFDTNIKTVTSKKPEKAAVDLTELKINEVLSAFQKRFIDSKIINRIKDDCNAFFSIRRQLLEKESVFHLKKSEIKSYLGAYYSLLVDFIIFYDEFDQKQERDIFIGELLHLDSAFNEANDICQLALWSPIALNKLQKVNDGIEAFFEQIAGKQPVKGEWMQKIYEHILLMKAQHNFRWYISGPDQKLLHAAIAPYVDVEPDDLKLQITARSLEQYNSYEGINELRLGEKIIYEYKLAEGKLNSEFRVAIMGDLHASRIEELYRYVDTKIEKPDKDFKIEFNIYTKNEFPTKETFNINYKGYPQDVLLDREELSSVIDENNIVFILDCVELYRSPMVEPETSEFVKHKYAFSAYDEYNTVIKEEADICDQNMLEELYETIICEQCFHQFGRISKQANEPLLEFCEKKQKEKGMKSAIYIYVSDMKAFNNIYNDDQYYIRTERYKQKEIGIIRYSSEKVTNLKVDKKTNILVFNLWQFIKNVAIEERDILISTGNASDDAYMELDKIYIGIDYTDWPNLLQVHYYSVKSKYKPVAVRFIKKILLPVLNKRSKDIFNIYIRKAMCSFFYSAAKNVNDMLFTHLFQDKGDLLGEVILAKENNEEIVKNNINRKFKYSSKRFYDMIMKNYDMSSNMYVGQIKTSLIIRKNEQREAKIQKNNIYRNVITACKNLSYEKGYLSKNCERELD